jgi:hypothetical protein
MAFAVSSIRVEAEQSRYFIIYEMIKEFIRIGRGCNPDSIQVAPQEEGFVTEHIRSDDQPSEDNDNEEVNDEITPRGRIEFVVFDGPGPSAKIRSIIQAKKAFDLIAEPFQLYAELLSSVEYNYMVDPSFTGAVAGIYSTGFQWQFYRALRDPNSTDTQAKYIIEKRAGRPLTFLALEPGADMQTQSKLQMAFLESGSTGKDPIRCIENIYCALFPDAGGIEKLEVEKYGSVVDERIKVLSDTFLDAMVNNVHLEKLFETSKAEREALKAKLAK